MAEREDLDEFTRALYRLRAYDREGNVEGLIAELGSRVAGRTMTVAEGAAERLAKHRDARAVHPLIGLLSESRLQSRSIAAYALGKIGHRDAVGPLLVTLNDSSPIVRAQSAVALGRIGDRRATEALVVLLSDPHKYARHGAATALGELGDVSAIRALEEARRREPFLQRRTRRSFSRALRSIRKKSKSQGNRP